MRFALPLAAIALFAHTAQAQQNATLTLDEAIQLARRNNPTFLETANARRSANALVRQAYASLLPSVSANLGGRYQRAGEQFVQGIALENTSDVMQSWYGIGLNYSINSNVLFAPRMAHANQNAAEADVTGAAEALRAAVTQQYLTVLAAQDGAKLQDTLLLTTRGQLELARARQAVGAVTILDVRNAEVAHGRGEVAALQAHNLARVEMLRLFQQLGVAQPTNVDLTTRFAVTPVTFELDSLLALAEGQNPSLLALRSRERAAGLNVRIEQGSYAPTLSLSTGWGGNASALTNDESAVTAARLGRAGRFADCSTMDSIRTGAGMPGLTCGSPTLSSAEEAAIREGTPNFPNQFSRAPLSFSVQLSMPIFDNLNRERQLQESMIQRDNARYRVRATELQLRADVTQQYLNLVTAARSVELQEVNAAAAQQSLAAAEERYRVGAGTFLEVTEARGLNEQAQADRLAAIYDYHRSFAALESAVGRPLR